MSKGKSLLDYGKFFPPNEYEKNDLFGFIYHRFILKKSIALSSTSIENLKTLKYQIFLLKPLF